MTHKLIIISIDALGAVDIERHKDKLPTLASLIDNGTHVKKIKGIYPTLTYPSHVTLMTGMYPIHHGIINNTKTQATRISPDWFWYDKEIKTPTVYDMAKKEGFKTAAFLWPVTASSAIDYNIAEIFPNRIWTNQVMISLKASSPLFLLQMNQKYGKLRKGIMQPYLDDFITACAIDTITNKKPDLTLIHLVDMDSMRHAFGVQSEEAIHALERQDARLKKIIQATKDNGTFEETNFVVLGDHYQIDVSTMIKLNALFVKKGWAEMKPDGTVKNNWQVYAKSCDGSTYIYTSKSCKIAKELIRETISPIKGVETIYSQPEISEMGADPNATFMVEAEPGFYFNDEANGGLFEQVTSKDIGKPNRYLGVHGFHPNKPNYETTVCFYGPDVKCGHSVESANLIDEAPTFAKLLNLKTFPKNTDGNIIEEIFK
ncbi:alkaline phosphatase family protein [Vagococcus hydrophili]|uniref:alkaline phosphatase family protein n=1 Tax=Vagococcus hydrophili TaxID=2714947 RepID=UPI003B82E7D9